MTKTDLEGLVAKWLERAKAEREAFCSTADTTYDECAHELEAALAASKAEPVTMSNDGNSEADFIAHHADACPSCGGSGHKADVREPAGGEAVALVTGALHHWMPLPDAKVAAEQVLAALSAPKPEGVEAVAWAVKGPMGETAHMGSVEPDLTEPGWSARPLVYGDTAPPRPEASDECPACNRAWTEHRIGYSASACRMKPQQASAPVGVEGLVEAWEKRAGELNDEGLYGCCAETYEQCAAQVRALAQQPAPSAPVGVEGLVEKWRGRADNITARDDYNAARKGTYEHCADQLEDALAQQPAAVDEAMERVRRGSPRLWKADLVGGKISVQRMRAILVTALAGQQQGGTPE